MTDKSSHAAKRRLERSHAKLPIDNLEADIITIRDPECLTDVRRNLKSAARYDTSLVNAHDEIPR